MENIINKCVEFLDNAFNKFWVVAATCLGGILLVFFITLIIGLFAGDFVRCKRACKTMIKGNMKKGLFKLKAQCPRLEEGSKAPPPAARFDYTKIIAGTYAYSPIKRLGLVTLVTAAFFAALSVPLCSLLETTGPQYTVFSVIACALLGFFLFIISLIISAASLKGANRKYFLMLDTVKRAEPQPAPRIANEYSRLRREAADNESGEISDSAKELCDRIKRLAREGGADVTVLKDLVARFEYERSSPKNAGYDAQQKLAGAGEILNMLLDSLAQTAENA